jgi:hypothetical protein
MKNKPLISPFVLFDKIFVISLPGADDRRQHIAQHLPLIGFKHFEFFDATQGNDPAVIDAIASGEVKQFPPCFRCGGLDCGNPHCNNFLNPAQVATFLSYLRLWRFIVDGAAERILVLEDDVFFHPQTARVLHWLASEVQTGKLPFVVGSACLLRLGWARCDDHLAIDALCHADTSIKMANPCHALTREYAAALLARNTGICHTVDVFQHQLAPQPGEAFTVYPPIASELSWTDGVFESTIRPKKVHMEHLLAQGDFSGANAYLKQISVHVDKKYFRPLLIVGHPRCGTGYAAGLCRQLGLDVGHEKLGKDGISSWMFAVEAEINPYALDDVARTRRAFAWEFLSMPVRDLATAVTSVMRDSQYAPPSYDFRQKHIFLHLGIDLNQLDSPLEKAIWSVTSWARIVLKQQPDICWRIEDQAELMREFLISSKLCSSSHKATILNKSPVNVNKPYPGQQYPKPIITPNDWVNLSQITRQEIVWYCERFGYSLPWSKSVENGLYIDDLMHQFLQPSGWIKSKIEHAPVDGNGQPLPWFTYAAIEFLQQIVRPDDRIFEYGAGNSTLWWQGKVAEVYSVEHDILWCERLRPLLGSNVQLIGCPIDSPVKEIEKASTAEFFQLQGLNDWDYDREKVIRRGLCDDRFVSYATRIDKIGGDFDFIVIDGMARRLCTWTALSHLKPDGFILLDNSNRSDYDLAYTLLNQAGFRQIPLWGLVPGADFFTCTSFFTRSLSRLPQATFAGNSLGLPEY